MKILIYTHEFPPITGGAGIYAYNLANGLKKIGEKVFLLGPIQDISSGFDNIVDFKLHRDTLNGRSDKTVKKVVTRFVKKVAPDHIIVADSQAQLYSARLNLLESYKYTIAVHGSELYRNFINYVVDSKIDKSSNIYQFYRNAENIIAISESTKKKTLEILPEFKNKIYKIIHGINIDLFPLLAKKDIEFFKEKLGIQNKTIIFNCSRLSPGKGHMLLLKIFSKLCAENDNLFLLIAGTGPKKIEIEQEIIRLKLKNKVKLLGLVDYNKLYKYYNISDLFIMISQRDKINDFESFGLVYLEAASCGKPSLASNIGGVSEAVEDNFSGILVNPKNEKEIYQKMQLMIINQNLRERMGKFARERTLNKFDNKIMADKTLKLLTNKKYAK